jgi:hypothetical protein
VATDDKYIPGECNIGPAEIKRRRQSGWFGLGATLLLWLAFWVFHVPAPWRLLLFFPAGLSAEGFLQAAFHFCAGFGMQGVFNFGSEIGKTETVEQMEFRRRDQRKALIISLYSALIGIAVAILGFLLIFPS